MKKFGCVLVMLLGFAGFVHASDSIFQLEVKAGGISTDNLEGVGGSKATRELSSNLCLSVMCLGGSIWTVTEPMDDDIGIVPQKGYTLEATSHTSNLLLYGFQYRKNDFFSQSAAMLGVSHGPIRIAALFPLSTDKGDGRMGFTGVMRTPLTKNLYAVFQYDYYGTQDPDTKVSQVGLGIGYNFTTK